MNSIECCISKQNLIGIVKYNLCWFDWNLTSSLFVAVRCVRFDVNPHGFNSFRISLLNVFRSIQILVYLYAYDTRATARKNKLNLIEYILFHKLLLCALCA